MARTKQTARRNVKKAPPTSAASSPVKAHAPPPSESASKKMVDGTTLNKDTHTTIRIRRDDPMRYVIRDSQAAQAGKITMILVNELPSVAPPETEGDKKTPEDAVSWDSDEFDPEKEKDGEEPDSPEYDDLEAGL